MIAQTVAQIKATLARRGFDVDDHLNGMSHMAAIEARRHGKTFTMREHVEGLVLAQLSSQRPWKAIEENIGKLRAVFLAFDPEALASADLDEIERRVRSLRCGNRQIRRQIQTLPENIACLQRIENERNGLNVYVQSDKPTVIARELGESRRYKLKQVGFTLALEYLRNVGIDAAKPDVHICQIIGPQRLGWARNEPSPFAAAEIISEKADEIGVSAAYLDGLLWLFAAKGYGDICGASPDCGSCQVSYCRQR
jgi:thermostable 8-oxoguanine DNA glycosylase